MRRALAALALSGTAALAVAQGTPRATASITPARPWMNAALAPARRARLLLAAMTTEEKFWQLFMTPGDPLRDSVAFAHGAYGVQLLSLRGERQRVPDARAAAAQADSVQRFFVERTRLGIPVILFEEGVHGLMQDGATVFPSAIGLAATFDSALLGDVAAVIARESRERGVRQLLSPVINLARDPRWGRVEETYGEDAWLSARLGVAYTHALERAGVVATPKHFVANHGDGGRDSYPVGLDAATLEDLYFPPFREAVRTAGARSVMASYNSVNGLPASASADLLTRTLRGAWRFNGVVVADQGGVGGATVLHHTAADYAEATARALRAGLDVIFQSHVREASYFWPAFRDGKVPRAAVDTAVVRVLTLKFALGLFDQPYTTPSDVRASGHDLAVTAAVSSLVLLRNDGVLPMRPSSRIAVIGAPGDATPYGGYSIRTAAETGLVHAINRRLSGDSVRHARGPGLGAPRWSVVRASALGRDSAGTRLGGLRAEFFANPRLEGAPASQRVDAQVDASWSFNGPARAVGNEWYAARWTGFIESPGDSVRLAVEGDDGYRLWIDETLVIDAAAKVSFGLRAMAAPLPRGRHTLRLEYAQTTGPGRVRLLWDAPRRGVVSDDAAIDAAMSAAQGADVAIVAATIDEGEFRDRSSLRLPGRQAELIERIAATGTRVVVVLYAGAAVITLPWQERTAAVLQAFYPGEGGAEAVARVLFGEANPSGRLPYTVPRSEGQLPLVYDHLPTGRGDDYIDLTGQPLYPFGYGLSYTSFAYGDLQVTPTRAAARDTVHVRFRVTNSGARAGEEVVQLYVRHVTAITAQPVLKLRGTAKVSLGAGESRVVDLTLPAAALAVRDEAGRPAVRDGEVIVYVGASSRDIRLRGVLTTVGAKR